MARLILSTNNITLENFSTARKSDSELSESELSRALRYKLRDTQDNFYLKYLDKKARGTQTQPQVSGLVLEYLSGYYVPKVDVSASPLAEERSQYEITAKIFYLSRADVRNKEYANDAARFVMRKLDVEYIDLLIVSFHKRLSNGKIENEEDFSEEDIEENIATWTALSLLQERGIVKKLGVADFNTSKLDKFLRRVKVSPKVNQINVKYCCNVAQSMLELAKLENIELLTHHDSGNILPNFSLGGILKLDREDADLPSHCDQSSDGMKNVLFPKWVVKYTAVVRDRGVIENKGYFAAIELLKS